MGDKVHESDYATPIVDRKRPTDWPRTLGFAILFNFVIISTNVAQFLWLFLLYPFDITRPYYERSISYSKAVFSRLIVAISQLFGPTKLVISCSDEDGNPVDPEQYCIRDENDRVVKFKLPDRSVWMSNHQVYLDWLYLWNLAHFSDLSDAIFIILRSGFEWIPFVGWGMRFFRFSFLKGNWEKDRKPLAKHLAFMASLGQNAANAPRTGASAPRQAIRGLKDKTLLLIFPEGTLVSKLTRPKSKAYADKQGIPDCTNLLLPRSTGLLFCLRSLAADVGDLKLVDFTIGYPGIPPAGYGQSHYTLRSVFMQGDSPPAVHIHFTVLRVRDDSTASSNLPPLGRLPMNAAAASLSSEESSPEEKKAFDDWLLEKWRQKDERMSRFYRDGDFVGGIYRNTNDLKQRSKAFVEVPVELRSIKEYCDMMLWGGPFLLCYLIYRLIRR